jgi:TonB-dependent SusC/RagA subfamily outer membrane receptor
MKPQVLFLILFVLNIISTASGQEKIPKVIITGVVADINQKPVYCALLLIDGVKTNKITDRKGKYKINVSTGAETIGILTTLPAKIEEHINGRSVINFTLDTSVVKQIPGQRGGYGEEEVNIGYGTEKRKNLTTSVGKIDTRKERYASYNSIYDLLRGELAGVQVDGKSIRIRTASSQVASNEPLIIVDGVPVSSLDGILPQLVRSIEVLKGSAASIYGARGSNGVIIISTADPKKLNKWICFIYPGPKGSEANPFEILNS